MQTSDYTCGPAALATVLQNMGFNVTEHELKVLAGTDETGTSMHGLAQAARSKGLNATGMRLSIDELRPDMIVHVIKDGTPHYSVIKEVTNESVRLADPSLGNIELTREKFNEIYTGNALVTTNPNMEAPGVVNETSNQTNNSLGNIEMTRVNEIYTGNALVITNPNMEAPGVSENLTTEEMETIKEQQLSASANMQLTAEEMQGIRGKGTRRRRRDVDSPRRMTREQRRQRREEIHRDLRTAERFGVGGAKIVGGSILITGGVMKGWNPTGWIAIGGGLVAIGKGWATIREM